MGIKTVRVITSKNDDPENIQTSDAFPRLIPFPAIYPFLSLFPRFTPFSAFYCFFRFRNSAIPLFGFRVLSQPL